MPVLKDPSSSRSCQLQIPADLCREMGLKGKRQMPSKSHSCSELQKGNKEILDVKQEAETEEDLARKIEDRG